MERFFTHFGQPTVQNEIVGEVKKQEHVKGWKTCDVTRQKLGDRSKNQLRFVVAFLELQKPAIEKKDFSQK